MLKTRITLVLVMLLSIQIKSSACDACGCSILGQPTGLLAAYRKSFISIGYGQAGFSAVPGTGEGAIDAFHTIDVSFDNYFSDRLRAGIYLPFRMNTRTINHSIQEIRGMADIRLDGNYTFFQKGNGMSPLEIYLEVGMGIILPTGKYIADIHSQNLPENFNIGNGSFGLSLQQTSGFSYRSVGAVLKNTWTDYKETAKGYEYGAQWVSSLLILAEIPVDSIVSVIPLGSIQYEKIWRDAYATGTEVHGTGGNGVFVSAGCQVKIKSWLCTFQYSLPVVDNYSQGEVNAGNRYTLQMTHLF